MFIKNHTEQELNKYHCRHIDTKKVIEGEYYFILTRVLGHPEMPGAEQWQIGKECYICDRWNYTLFLKVHEKKDA